MPAPLKATFSEARSVKGKPWAGLLGASYRNRGFCLAAAFCSFSLLLSSCSVLKRVPSAEERQSLGEELLLAASKKKWNEVKGLLARGADPNVVVLPPRLAPRKIGQGFEFRAERKPEVTGSPLYLAVGANEVEIARLLIRAGADIEGKANPVGWYSPLQLAVHDRKLEMTRLLVSLGASLSRESPGAGDALRFARYSGSEPMIRLVEDLAEVPLWNRTLPAAPYAPGARDAMLVPIPGTRGAVPVRCPLWLSDHELLLLRKSPLSFSLLNITTGVTTSLDRLSKAWEGQPAFDHDMFTLSPDGKWLLGFGGTTNRPTWLATTILTGEERTWPRDTDNGASRISCENQPPVVWVDATRWLELRKGRLYRARLRSVTDELVTEVPLTVPDYISDHPSSFIALNGGVRGHHCGSVGIRSGRSDNPPVGYHAARMLNLLPASTGWQIEVRQAILPLDSYPGSFMPSPFACPRQRDRIAWVNYFSATEARAVVVSDVEGKNAQVVYQHLYSMENHMAGRAAAPHSLSWTPKGDALLLWRGGYGENGLCLLPLTNSHAKPIHPE